MALTVKPINEIFICFGLEEFFEGKLEDLQGQNFDVLEQLSDDKESEETNSHMEAILNKRKM